MLLTFRYTKLHGSKISVHARQEWNCWAYLQAGVEAKIWRVVYSMNYDCLYIKLYHVPVTPEMIRDYTMAPIITVSGTGWTCLTKLQSQYAR